MVSGVPRVNHGLKYVYFKINPLSARILQNES